MGRPKGSVLTPEHRKKIADGVQRHHRNEVRGPVVCEECGKELKGSRGLAIHRGYKHKGEETP